MLAWDSDEHTDGENVSWTWLRAIEWGSYPVFLSQPIIPILLIFFSWKIVVVSLVSINLILVALFRYKPFIKTSWLSYGIYFVKIGLITCPAAAAYLYFSVHNTKQALLALLWLLVAMVIGNLPPPEIGRIQKTLLAKMGYTKIAGQWFRITAEQIAEAQTLAREWQPK